MTIVESRPDVATLTAGWFPDPFGQHQLRFFDGETWTNHVTHFGPSPCRGCAR